MQSIIVPLALLLSVTYYSFGLAPQPQNTPQYLLEAMLAVKPEVEIIERWIKEAGMSPNYPLNLKIKLAYAMKHGVSHQNILDMLRDFDAWHDQYKKHETQTHHIDWMGIFETYKEQIASIFDHQITPDFSCIFVFEPHAELEHANLLHLGQTLPTQRRIALQNLTPEKIKKKASHILLIHEFLHFFSVGFHSSILDEGFTEYFAYKIYKGYIPEGAAYFNYFRLVEKMIQRSGKSMDYWKQIYISGDIKALEQELGDDLFYMIHELASKNSDLWIYYKNDIIDAVEGKLDQNKLSMLRHILELENKRKNIKILATLTVLKARFLFTRSA